MMFKQVLLVALGGAVGTALRFGVGQLFRTAPFPWATLLVNLAGCLAIGMIAAVCVRNAAFEQQWRLVLATGICGGFTTYSAFSLELLSLLQQQKFWLFALYLLVTVVGGLLASWLGYTLLRGA